MQTQEPLNKSVEASSLGRVSSLTFFLGIALIFSVFVNMMTCGALDRRDDQHDRLARMWQNEQDARESAERHLGELQESLHETTSGARNAPLSSDAGREFFRACMDVSGALDISPKVLNWGGGATIAFDNAVPLRTNADTQEFLPGEKCRVAEGSRLRIHRAAGVYVLELRVDDEHAYTDTCPDGTYVLVSDKNEIVQKIVRYTCRNKAAAFELKRPYL